MEVYVYDTEAGLIADFRPYLDGQDRAWDPPRPLGGGDPRWEKILNTNDPRTGDSLYGRAKFVGKGEIPDYHELMIFPVEFDGEFERLVDDAVDDAVDGEAEDGSGEMTDAATTSASGQSA